MSSALPSPSIQHTGQVARDFRHCFEKRNQGPQHHSIRDYSSQVKNHQHTSLICLRLWLQGLTSAVHLANGFWALFWALYESFHLPSLAKFILISCIMNPSSPPKRARELSRNLQNQDRELNDQLKVAKKRVKAQGAFHAAY